MQKMIFSAVALVAFSFAGMANEIEEKKVEDTKIIMREVCYKVWLSQVKFYHLECGATVDDAILLADRYLDQCLNNPRIN